MVDLKGLKFSKMHGIGNDFPIIDESKGEVIPEADKKWYCALLLRQKSLYPEVIVLFEEKEIFW